MPLQIVRNDITRMQVDAIVNAANERLLRGGGVCGAIFAAAGARELQAACDQIGHCPTGGAVITPGFALPARHVIHAVGPVWHGGNHGESIALRSCYQTALRLAHELGDASIAFPLISSGIYGYPRDQAIDVALNAIRDFLQTHEMDVYLTIFDAASLVAGQARFARIAAYIDDRYVDDSPYLRRRQWERSYAPGRDVPEEPLDSDASSAARRTMASPTADSVVQDTVQTAQPRMMPAPSMAPSPASPRAARQKKPRASLLNHLFKNLDASFSTTLMRMIDERHLKDSEVYKRANMSRQHFSKIRGNPDYRPKKQTVLALSVALCLTLDDTRLLLERAGFALTHADKRDVVVEYFIQQGTYDIYEINLALYAFDLPLLG